MFDRIILLSLRYRLAVVLLAALLLGWGGFALTRLPVDVFPDLNRPTVTVMTEAGGLSPEEVEALVTRPIETAMNGAPYVKRVRSTSGVGLSVVYIEFDWGSDIYLDRQLVAERLAHASERLPKNVLPVMTPVSSIMGEVLLIGMRSKDGALPPMEVRSWADWSVRPRVLSIPGVAQVSVMGGGVRQYQVQVDPNKLVVFGLSLEDVERAAAGAQMNSTGGFLEKGGRELLIRNLARSISIEDLADTVIQVKDGVPIRLRHVATVKLDKGWMRGDAGIDGSPGVILSVQKQPRASTLTLTAQIEEALAELGKGLPPGLELKVLFRQASFIEHAVANVVEALRDGAILVSLVLLLFLVNLRTTAITLTAIPLSLLITTLVMAAAGVSVNTMTLGGMAVAIGELVDDAIVDVENVLRRLRENARLPEPRPALAVIYRASSEVRGSIVFATLIVVLVFVPLFALSGIEGRLFLPLGVAYVASILASLLVSLTVTPALCSFLLPRAQVTHRGDGALVTWLKGQDRKLLALALDHPRPVLGVALALVVLAAATVPFLGREFMPPFNEGTATISLIARPGTSLEQSNRLGTVAERELLAIPEVASVGRRTGRAEQDEHAEGVHSSELDIEFREEGDPPPRSRAVVLEAVRARLGALPGVHINVGQPISHRLDHLLSGVRAQIAVKIFGGELDRLRAHADTAAAALAKVPGVVDLQVEAQVLIPELRVKVERERAAQFGLSPGALAEHLETALAGRVVGEVIDGPKSYEILVRLDEASRGSIEAIGRILLRGTDGALFPLSAVASISEAAGPNVVQHEHGERRIVVMANTSGRSLGAVVADVRAALARELHLGPGEHLRLEGQFESQEEATRLISLLALLSLAAAFTVLYLHFRSTILVLQVLLNIPLALVGSVAAVWLADGVLSVATLVGFITLCGIASRNTIMMISHYLHLVTDEGERFSRALIVRGSLERLVPVLMTALTAALALIPLVLARGQAGKEILHPVAVVILGGLVSSTLLDMAVTPAAFWLFGERGLAAYLARMKQAKEEER